jgi:hypothetical protein
MAFVSSAELLTLHGVRILGMADTNAVSRRFSLDADTVDELLLDHESRGWVRRVGFADLSGWALTESGREQDNRSLAVELTQAGVRDSVAWSHAAFVELNARFLRTITNWQIRPIPGDPLATNDHSDWRWDENVLGSLAGLSRSLRPIGDRLADDLRRFAGYPDRFAAALERVDQGQRKWVDGTRIDSCHTVWFELHEDLLSTLGLERCEGA